MSNRNDDGEWEDGKINFVFVDLVWKQRARLVVVLGTVIFGIGVTLRLLPKSTPYTNPATGAKTVDRWDSLSHYAFGYEPTSRSETYPDGRVMKGPLQGRERHGTWTVIKNGEETYHVFQNGKPR